MKIPALPDLRQSFLIYPVKPLIFAAYIHFLSRMSPEIRIIFVEDVPADALLVERALRRDGLVFQLQRVDTREEFLQALSARAPDLILSDHGLPAFDGFTALALAHEKCPDVPFIFVTNALTWEMEIEKLAPGVTDFILKRQLEGLAPTIRRALFHAGILRESRLKQQEREQSVVKLLALLAEYEPTGGFIPICANCKKIRDRENIWQAPEVFFKKKLGLNFTHGICPDCIRQFYGASGNKSA
jgi:CheY-like chemotaxis protein